MPDNPQRFEKPNPVERIFNSAFGLLVKLGLGMRHNYLVEVRGRKTGRLYSNPINLLEVKGKQYLIAPRGYTQWVRNAEAAGQVNLRKGSKSRTFKLRPLTSNEKPELLKAYLDSFKPTVQRYFPVPAGSPATSFADLADRYPAFELLPTDDN